MCERQQFTAGDYNGNTCYIVCDIHGVPELPSSSGTIVGAETLASSDVDKISMYEYLVLVLLYKSCRCVLATRSTCMQLLAAQCVTVQFFECNINTARTRVLQYISSTLLE
jgi:hypothetical protein